jgi:hypothetical protein
MQFNTTVHVFLEDTSQPLPGVKVSLYDHDRRSRDDLLGTKITDQQGKAQFIFSERDFADRFGVLDDPKSFPSLDMKPDLYAIIHAPDGSVVASTKSRVAENRPPRTISVSIGKQQALDGGLIERKKRPTAAQRRNAWDAYWRDRKAKDPGPGPDAELCFTRHILSTMANLNNPRTDIEKKAVDRLKQNLSPTQIGIVAKLAAGGRQFFDKSDASRNVPCSRDTDLEDLAKMMINVGGPLHRIFQALTTVQLPPSAGRINPKSGSRFEQVFKDWKDHCIKLYESGSPLLSHAARTDMDQYYRADPDDPDALRLLTPPRVNEIEVFAYFDADIPDANGRYVRHGNLTSNVLTFHQLDETVPSQQLDMHVPLGHDDCVVFYEDEPGIQVFVVDVTEGQEVLLKGSGFVNETAKLKVQYAPWRSFLDAQNRPTPVDEQGRLVPGSPGDLPGWDGEKVNVFGLVTAPTPTDTPETFSGDEVVLVWPDIAKDPGLYKIELIFDNTTGTPTTAVQNDDCRLKLDFEAKTQPLYFAVLPSISAREVKVRSPRVECIDETEPSFGPFYDDVRYSANVEIKRFSVNRASPRNPQTLGYETILEIPPDDQPSDNYSFFSEGEWFPNLQILPDNQPVNMNEILTVTLTALEIDEGFAQYLVYAIAIIILVYITEIILSVAVSAVIFSILLGMVLGGPIGAGAALTASATIAAGVAAAILGAIWSWGLDLASHVATTVGESDVIAFIGVPFSGIELASMFSKVRFHQKINPHPRFDPPAGERPVTRTATEVQGNLLKETYRSNAVMLGGIYDFDLVVEVR